MKQTLWIPGPLAGTNEMVKKAKGYGGKGRGYSSHKRKETERIEWLARAARLLPMKRAAIHFEWREKTRRRDPDNFRMGAKYVLDGLVRARVLSDDGWAEIIGLSDSWLVDKERPGVFVTLTDE